MKIGKLTLIKYTFPLILSGLAEQLLLLTDVFLMSFKGDQYLAAIGLIDAFLLCSLSYGFALNDTFQNFYSRNSSREIFIKNIFKESPFIFVKSACLISLLFSTMAYLISFVLKNDIYQLFVEQIPVIIPLIIISYLSMSMNSFLLGLGKTKEVGLIAIACIITNAVLGYVLLFEINPQLPPLTIILVTSIVAEVIGIIMMYKAIQIGTSQAYKKELVRKILLATIKKASYYPALSDLSFHIGSFILFLFCSIYLNITETALLTIILSYWGILLVPAEAFSETALNYFSKIYTEKKSTLFRQLRKNIVTASLSVSAFFLIALLFIDYILYGSDTKKMVILSVVTAIVFVATFNEILSISLTVRLKNNLFATSKIIYGSVAVIFILILVLTWKKEALSIVVSLLFAQIVLHIFLLIASNRIWHMNSSK